MHLIQIQQKSDGNASSDDDILLWQFELINAELTLTSRVNVAG